MDGPAFPDGIPCDDGNACTTGGFCVGGACGTLVVCTALDECHDAGACDPATGCSNPENTAACDDGNACTTDDVCSDGSCQAGTAPDCSAFGSECNTASCNPAGVEGNCDTLTPLSDGTACDDGDLCNGDETCQTGQCTAGTTLVCDDGNVCTDDSCVAATGCVNANNTAGCDDGLFCNGLDSCSDGACESAGDPCASGEECNNTCSEDADNCFSAATNPCGSSDETACDNADTCDGTGACQDNFVVLDTACGDPDDTECNDPDTCDGAGTCRDNFEAITTSCRADAGDCDVEEFCDGAGNCPDDSFELVDTACGDDTNNDCNNPDTCDGAGNCLDKFVVLDTACGDDFGTNCTDPDTCDGSGICLANNRACAQVTDSSLCPFDFNSNKNDDQFRLLFTPDGQNWPAYKLNASNPGQFYYNLFYGGPFPATLTITVPYPFVTQGAVPVHVYDGLLVGGDQGCFLPPAELEEFGQQIVMEDYLPQGPVSMNVACDEVCGPDGEGFCSFDVYVEDPGSGLVYVNVHLDHGLKGSHLDVNPCDDALTDRYDLGILDQVNGGYAALVDNEDGTGELAIANCTPYEFSHTDYMNPLLTDTIENLNVFRHIAGGFGLVSSSDTGSGVEGVWVDLVEVSTDELLGSGVTDEDGFYMIPYKHKGRSALCSMELGAGYDLFQDIELKANGWAEVNLDVFTGTSTGEFNLHPKGNKGGEADDPACTSTEDPEVSCSDGIDNDCDALVDGADTDCGGGEVCTAGQNGDSCTVNSDCCSNKCRGKLGNKTCK